MLGLVLTAGGARGAYQAGVLQRIGELPSLRNRPSPFAIVTGASAGAINGTFLAARSSDIGEATRELAELWTKLKFSEVVRTDPLSLLWGSLKWMRDLSLGGLIGAGNVHSVFDATPLYKSLGAALNLKGIGDSIARGELFAAAVSATSYHSGRSFTFVQGRPGIPLWTRARRVTLATELTTEHVCASAAIPIVFPPVKVRTSAEGECYFGDGALRLVAPLSPAIRLGASRIFSIGVRCAAAATALQYAELSLKEGASSRPIEPVEPPIAQICGVFLNALFLDHLDSDLDHLLRMNELVSSGQLSNGNASMPSLRVVKPFSIAPSADLALVAAAFAHRMPFPIRYAMDGLGMPDAQSADLMSYLLFDSSFTRALLDIGYHDATAKIDQIEEFLLNDWPEQNVSLSS
jgi:NTE family protein